MHYPVTVPIPRTSLPAAVTLLDVQHHDLPGAFSRAEGMFRRRAYDRAARDADVVLTISEFSRERIVEVLGIPPDRVVAVHLGVDHDRFSPEGPGSDLDLPERFVFYPANLWPHKNHERLVQALALAPGVELVLSGQDYGRLPGLMEAARAAGVAERVRHVGHVPHGGVAALYRSATAVIFPSLYEGFGLPPLEAMAAGCPVAVARAGSLPEVVGDAGLLFDPRDAEAMAESIRALWDDDAERERLSRAGRERSLGFSWQAAAERHVAAYRGLLG
jgi:glycosyltransferase involved in cell wall biosynthesis